MKRAIALALALVLAITLAACSSSSGSGDNSDDLSSVDPGDCIVVDMASSPEKITLMTELAKEFNGSDQAKVGDKCVFVRPRSKASGAGAALLSAGWPEPDANGPQPVIWSPAASALGRGREPTADRRRARRRSPSRRSRSCSPRSSIAMPKPMAEALGYPTRPLGFADILALANDPEGWAAFGHPEWGPFRLGKTNPNFSTSGLNFTIAQYYAATGQDPRPHAGGPRPPDVQAFVAVGRVGGRALRRHDAHVPQQLYKADAARHRAHLRVGGRRRGEVGDRLQHRQPRRHPRSG